MQSLGMFDQKVGQGSRLLLQADCILGAGQDWSILEKDGTIGSAEYSLEGLRQQARDEQNGAVAWGIIVVRQSDNLWLKLDFVSSCGLPAYQRSDSHLQPFP